jgi:hypothetical protein
LADPGQTRFDQVLAAPDDVKLNLQYAQEQANAGHLLEAAAALERILLTEPNRADVRLFYVAVLYRLDDLQDASEQLKRVDVNALTPLQKAEADRYQRLIEGRSRRGIEGVRIGGEIAAGVAYDSDAAGALLTQLQFSPSFPITKQSGTGAVVSGDAHVSLPIGPGEKTTVTASLAGYDRETISGGQDQLQIFDGRIGLSRAGTWQTFSVMGIARTYQVLDHHLLDEFGGRGQALVRLNTATNILLAVEGVQQSYQAPPGGFQHFGPFVLDDSGPLYDVEVDVSHRFGAATSVLAGIGYENKIAEYRSWSYQAPFFKARLDQVLPRGSYLVVSGGVRFVQYDGPDILLLNATRRDTRADARAAFGVPLSAFAPQGATGDWRERLAFEIAATWSNRGSTFPVTGYEDWGAQARLIWRFGARD